MCRNANLPKVAVFLLTLLSSLAGNPLSAQTAQIGSGTSTPPNTLYSPLYRLNATSTTTSARSEILYTAAELTAAGIPSGAIITGIAFNKTSTSVFTPSASYRILAANTTNTTLSTTTTWASIVASFTEVYSNTTYNVPGTTGWVDMPISPFTYAGNSLEFAFDLSMAGNGGATGNLAWEYTDGFSDKIVGATATGTTAVTTLSSAGAVYKHRPNIRITYTLNNNCSGTPQPGTLSSSVSNVCVGQYFSLTVGNPNLSNGVSYQWEYSTDNATWLPLTSQRTGISRNILDTFQSQNLYYRAALRCNNGTAAYTNSVYVTSPPLVTGTFTINQNATPSATTFTSFASAIASLNCGIGNNGNVVFNVAPNSGPYTEQIIIPAIRNASANNRVVFNGNGNSFTFATVTANRPVIHLNGADFVTLDSFIIDVTAAAGWGVALSNSADSNIIRRSTINLPLSSTGTEYIGIAINNSISATGSSGTNGSGNLIENNTINGGGYNIYCYGSTSAAIINTRNKIRNNTLRDAGSYGVHATYQQELLVSGNDVSRQARTAPIAGGGIYMNTGVTGALIEKNRVHDLSPATTTVSLYGIYMLANPAETAPNRVENNLIYNFLNNNGLNYGLWASSADYTFFYHNTVVLDNTSSTAGNTYGIYQSGTANGLRFQNNLVYVTRGGTGTKRAVYMVATTADAWISNNNAFYFAPSGSNNAFAQNGTTNYTDLAAWKNAGFDLVSQEGDPDFTDVSTGNFKPRFTTFDGIGAPNLGVTTDILNTQRGAAPDPGAYEFTGTGCVNPPTPGQAILTGDSLCAGSTFSLSLIGNSSGTGQTYQWQISPDNANWTNLFTPARTTFSLDTFQTATSYYRVLVRCGSGTAVASTSVLVYSFQPLNGAYTVDKGLPTGNRNFASFADLNRNLRCGVTGLVTINVNPNSGTYNEQVIFDSIPGASAQNRIRILGNGATISAAPLSANRSIIRLDNAQYFTIDSLVLKSTSTTYGWGIHLLNGARYDSVRACTIDMSAITNNTESNSIGIFVGGNTSFTSVTTGGSGNFNTFYGNTIIGAYKSIGLIGLATAQGVKGNRISNNTLINFYTTGVELNDADSNFIEGNNINRATRTATASTFYGINLSSNAYNTRVTKNRIHDPNASITGASAIYGIFTTTSDALPGRENRFENNVIYNLSSNTSGAIYGIHNTGSNGAHYIHNTIHIESPGTTGLAYGFYQTTDANNIRIYNNLFYVNRNSSGAKYALFFNTATSTIRSNYNLLFNPGITGTNGIGYAGGNGYTDIAAWKNPLNTPYDTSSISVDPLFADISQGDLTPTEPQVNGAGTNEGVTTDILGRPRTVTPDPGAFELILAGCSGTPTAGQAISSDTIPCVGLYFSLNLTNNASGTGIRYQWQRSVNNSTWFNIGALQANPLLDTFQNETSYYRVAVTCNNGTPAYSTPVFVRVPATFAGGTYTINPGIAASATNFTSMVAAVSAIRCGIGGPVIFNVAPGGFFTDQVEIKPIPGSSTTNYVRFNGNGATLSFNSTNGTNRAGIRLNGARHIYIDSFIIQATGTLQTEFGYGIQLMDDADSNTIARCNITTTSSPATVASTQYAGIVINATATGTPIAAGNSLCDGNVITGNTVTGGYAGITLVGNGTTTQVSNNRITNNTVTDFYIYGIYQNGGINTLISGNNVSRSGRSSISTFYGIYVGTGSRGTSVTANKIHAPMAATPSSTTIAYGVYHTGADGTTAQLNVVANNFVYDFRSAGTQTAFYNSSSDNTRYYYNSVLLDDPGSLTTDIDTRAFYQVTVAVGIELMNNNFVITRGGTAPKELLYFSTATTTFNSRFNNLYITPGSGRYIANVGGTATTAVNYSDLTDWKNSAPARDTGSISDDPQFVSNTDLHLQTGSTLIGAGRPISAVTTDIDGQSRGLTVTTMGADEKAAALPVSWLGFTAVADGNVNRLQWITAQEQDNTGFEVQLSANGNQFETIGKVAAGRSGSTNRYDFTDGSPLANGTYYRIAQLDNSVRAGYSKTLFVAGRKTQWALTAVYPNPVRTQLTAEIGAPAVANATLLVLNAQGATVMQQQLRLQAGSNRQVLNVSALAQGSYLLKVVCSEGCETLTTRFVKQ